VKEAVERGSGGFFVGPWRVEPARNLLEHEGKQVRLEPKVMEVLVHLASRASEVVSRDELQNAVWGTPYVSEDLPRRAVYKLRKVFDDDPRCPEFIETIPRSGYRLVAPLGPLTEPPAERPSAELASATNAPASTHRWRRFAPAFVAVLLLAGSLGLVFHRRGHQPLPSDVTITPLTALPGLEYDPAFSPDGSRVAFLRVPNFQTEGEMTLEVQLVGAESSLRVSEEPASFASPIASPTWSPDGSMIAFLRWRADEGWGIYEVPALGGAERKVLALGAGGASGLSWSPDGRSLAVGLRPDNGGPFALFRVDLETLKRERLTDPPGTIGGDILPIWSPDGTSLAFVRNITSERSEVRTVSSSGGGSRSVLSEQRPIGDIDWSMDGRWLVLSVHEGGRHRIWSVEVATGDVRRADTLGHDARWLSVARQTGELVYGQARWEVRIRRYDLTTGESTVLPGLSSTFFDAGLDLSPDGNRLALVSTRSGSTEIWANDLEGRRPFQLTRFEGPTVGHPRWVGRSGSIVFQADTAGGEDLWLVDADGTSPSRLTDGLGNERVPSVSQDGETIYFASDRSGEWQVWSLPVDGGPATQVTEGGGYFAQESADGKWLYYTRWQTDGLWRAPLVGGEEERVLGDEPSSQEWGNWALADEGIYVVTWNQGHAGLVLYSLEGDEMVRRFSFLGEPVRPSLTLSSTGDLFLAEVDRIESDIVLARGFGSWLR